MSNIVKFPRASKPPAPEPVQPAAPAAAPAAPKAEGRGLVAGLVKFVWVATVLVWPVLKWVLAIITFFQFVRMLYHWNTPGGAGRGVGGFDRGHAHTEPGRLWIAGHGGRADRVPQSVFRAGPRLGSGARPGSR